MTGTGTRKAFDGASATAFAPATVANVASGFDILGFAIEGLGDRVTVTRDADPGVRIRIATGGPAVPTEPERNTAGKPLLAMLAELGAGFGFTVEIEKGIPLGSGLGGSAASAVGAVVAANALLENPFPRERLLEFALEGEAVASGAKHADNVAPCLYGGFTLSTPGTDARVKSVPFPAGIHAVVVHPEFVLETKAARAALGKELTLRTHIDQSSRLASLVLGLCTGDFDAIARGLEDVLVEPQRASLIPGFGAVKRAALDAGAIGASISGAGPSVFAWARDAGTAARIRDGMVRAFADHGKLSAKGSISALNRKGASLVDG
jgi:homoserine kinase